jgi:hypothetical protein
VEKEATKPFSMAKDMVLNIECEFIDMEKMPYRGEEEDTCIKGEDVVEIMIHKQYVTLVYDIDVHSCELNQLTGLAIIYELFPPLGLSQGKDCSLLLMGNSCDKDSMLVYDSCSKYLNPKEVEDA